MSWKDILKSEDKKYNNFLDDLDMAVERVFGLEIPKEYENEHKDLVGFIRKLKKYKSNPKDHLDKIGEIEERVHYIFDEITMVSPPSYID